MYENLKGSKNDYLEIEEFALAVRKYIHNFSVESVVDILLKEYRDNLEQEPDIQWGIEIFERIKKEFEG